MSKKRVYAAIEIADQEIRLIVLEIFEARYNVLRTERVACSGVDKNQKIVDESAIVTAIRQAITNAQAALGYRIERVLLAVPSVNVMRSSQKVRVQIEDGTKQIYYMPTRKQSIRMLVVWNRQILKSWIYV